MPQVGASVLQAFEGLSEPEQRTVLSQMSDTTKQALLGAIKAKQGVARVVDPAKNLVASPSAPQQSDVKSFFSGTPQPGTLGYRADEAIIGAAAPFSARDASGNWQMPPAIQGLIDTGKAVAKVGLSTDPATQRRGIGELKDIAFGMYHSAVDPLRDYVKSVGAGDWDAASLASGQILSQTAPAVAGAVDTVRGALPSVGKLRETARSAAQSATGAAASKTTVPIVEDFNAKIAENAAKVAEQKAGHATAVSETLAENRAATKTASRVEGVERSVEEGSKELGSRVKNLDALLREEANGKYQTVREAVKDDPGVPLQDLAEAARHAENNILKGSSENIKQFREIIKNSKEAESSSPMVDGKLMADGQLYGPETPLFQQAQAMGITEAAPIPFDELQGYSSEIGQRLAQGGLHGDVYQALKYVKEKIDTAKATIADRNGAGAVLRNADSFWRNYMDLFYDSDSAIAKVRESVGVKNPQEAVNEFFRGNADELAVGKLKKMKSVYAKDASAVADLARNLKSARGEVQATTVPKVSELPAAPKPPKAPVAPTAEDIVAAKAGKVQAKGESFAEMRPRDAYVIAGPLVGGLLGGHWLAGLASGLGIEAAVKGVGAALTRPQIIEWISRPTAADLAAVEKLPPETRAAVRQGLQKLIAEETKTGRRLTIAPAVQRLISSTGTASGGVKSRRDALEVLGQPTP